MTAAGQGSQEDSPQRVWAPGDWSLAGMWLAGRVRLPHLPSP